MKTKIVSFYSDVDGGTYYSDHAARLKKECEELGVPYDIQEKSSEGSYQKNCLSKPQYIYDKLKETREPFVWLDIDSYLLKKPDIFDHMVDKFDLGFAMSVQQLSGLKASPIFIGATPNVEIFLENWIMNAAKTLEMNKKHFDHEPLFGLVQHFMNQMKVAFVGKEYCTWPREQNNDTVIMMGLSDVESKKENLRAMGMSEEKIEWQSTGKL